MTPALPIPFRGMIADFNLDPTRGSETGKIRPCIVVTNDVYNRRVPVVQVIPVTAWNEKKCRIAMNVELSPSTENGLTKLSIADCLQTRPVDFAARCVQMRGRVDAATLTEIDTALRIVFGLG